MARVSHLFLAYCRREIRSSGVRGPPEAASIATAVLPGISWERHNWRLSGLGDVLLFLTLLLLISLFLPGTDGDVEELTALKPSSRTVNTTKKNFTHDTVE